MPACTEQKNIRYHQTKTNPSPKCGFLDKIMETWGIHINGHLNAKTLFDLNLEDLSSRSCSCTPLYPLYTSSVLKEYSTDFTLQQSYHVLQQLCFCTVHLIFSSVSKQKSFNLIFIVCRWMKTEQGKSGKQGQGRC